MVTDRLIVRAKQPLVGGREHDQLATRVEPAGGEGGFCRVGLNVLEHVDVQDGIEPIQFRE